MPGWDAIRPRTDTFVIGVFQGEGCGTEVIGAALDVLDAVRDASPAPIEVRLGCEIGLPAKRSTGSELPPAAASFCESIFADGGAILCGPGGGRFVYDLRARFQLYCKLVPLRPLPALRDAGVLRPRAVDGVDVLLVRENVGGVYFGDHESRQNGVGLAEAHHHFRYDAQQVQRILRVALELARKRRGRLGVVVKPAGVPSISQLWIEQAHALNANAQVELQVLEVDNACYQIVADAARFDVLVAPNLFGDVIGDTSAVLLGSRGLSFSGNFGEDRRAVYQTAHGSAHDLAGQDRVNPIGQIQSLAMLLHESFGLVELRQVIERAIGAALASGCRTADILAPGCRLTGTRELGRRIAGLARAELSEARGER